jgi:hypothetical protein
LHAVGATVGAFVIPEASAISLGTTISGMQRQSIGSGRV